MTPTVQHSSRFPRIVLISSPFHGRSRHRFVRITREPLRSPIAPTAPRLAASGEAAQSADLGESADAWARRVSSAIARGSREALGELYEAKFDFIVAIARERTRRDESFALDCVHDTMIRVAESLDRVERMESLDSWLRRVVLSAAIDRLRSERSRHHRDLAHSSLEREVDDARLRDLEHELAGLAAEDRSLLSLRFGRGLTLQQMAHHLGQAPKAIDSRIRRLVARLRASLLGHSVGDAEPMTRAAAADDAPTVTDRSATEAERSRTARAAPSKSAPAAPSKGTRP